MKIDFIARVWEISGANVINIPKKLVKLFKIKKNQHYKVTLELIEQEDDK